MPVYKFKETHKLNGRYRKIKRISKSDLIPLWTTGHHDGTRAGMVLYKGKIHYACHDGDLTSRKTRRFTVVELSDDQIVYVQQLHTIWQRYVGHHCDCNPDWTRKSGPYISNDKMHNLYYGHPMVKIHDPYKYYEENIVVGWFGGWHKDEKD